MDDSVARWRRSVEVVGVGGLALVLAFALGMTTMVERDLEQAQAEGGGSAPSPNLPGRLDGNSVGKSSDSHRQKVVERWTSIGDQVNSGTLTRVPPEVSEAITKDLPSDAVVPQ